MRIIRAKDYDDMSAIGARIIGAQVLLNPESVLGLATGGTPVGAYKLLIEQCKAGNLDFSKVSTVNLDEYTGLSPDHEQSYRRFMNENLFNHINIDKERTHVPQGDAADPEAECKRYDALIESFGGVDLQLLGIGHNGHIGFNEPGDFFVAPTNLIGLTQSTREANKRYFDSIEDVPTHAITTGMKGIMTAKSVLLLASGKGKAQAVRGIIEGPVTPQNPASLLALHPNFILVADAEALSE